MPQSSSVDTSGFHIPRWEKIETASQYMLPLFPVAPRVAILTLALPTSRRAARASSMSLSSLLNLPSSRGFMSRVRGGSATPSHEEAPTNSSDLEPTAGSPERCLGHDKALRRYVCDHNSAPPAHQYITTDKTNILIRALTGRRAKDELAGRASASPKPSGAPGPQSQARRHPGASAGGGGAGGAGRVVGAAGSEKGSASPGSALPARGSGGGVVGSIPARGGGGGGSSSRLPSSGPADEARGKRVASQGFFEPSGSGGLGRHPPAAAPSGLERPAKRPAIDATSTEYARLEGLSVEQLREVLRSRGQTVGVDNAGRAALLARAKLSLHGVGGGR